MSVKHNKQNSFTKSQLVLINTLTALLLCVFVSVAAGALQPAA
jgi:hypothetical protein